MAIHGTGSNTPRFTIRGHTFSLSVSLVNAILTYNFEDGSTEESITKYRTICIETFQALCDFHFMTLEELKATTIINYPAISMNTDLPTMLFDNFINIPKHENIENSSFSFAFTHNNLKYEFSISQFIAGERQINKNQLQTIGIKPNESNTFFIKLDPSTLTITEKGISVTAGCMMKINEDCRSENAIPFDNILDGATVFCVNKANEILFG